jgi:hypothetical protein
MAGDSVRFGAAMRGYRGRVPQFRRPVMGIGAAEEPAEYRRVEERRDVGPPM